MGRPPPPERFSLFCAILAVAGGAMTVLCLLLHRLVPVVFEWPWSAALLVGALSLIAACVAAWRAIGEERRGEATLAGPAGEVTPDAIYTQLYTEMRRFGERQKAVVAWYTAILLAMIGAVISYWPDIDLATEDILKLNVILAALIVAVTGTVHYLIWYTNRRYRDLREYTNNHYDIEPNRPVLALRSRPLPGHTATIILLWVLTVAFGCVLFHMSPDGFSDSSHMRHPKARSSQFQTLRSAVDKGSRPTFHQSGRH